MDHFDTNEAQTIFLLQKLLDFQERSWVKHFEKQIKSSQQEEKLNESYFYSHQERNQAYPSWESHHNSTN